MPSWSDVNLNRIGISLDQCPSCSSRDIRSAGHRKDGSSVSRCSGCGLGFLNPMPTESEIIDMYNDYYSRKDGIGYERYPFSEDGDDLDFLIWDVLKRFIRKHKGMRLLDVGCAFGNRVNFFARKGFQASGLDTSVEATNFGKKSKDLDLMCVRFEDFNSKLKYDIISMIALIEHLSNPLSWALKLKEITKRGGILIIFTPNFECYDLYGEQWLGYHLSFEHVIFYNRQSISSLLGRMGFEIIWTEDVKVMPPVVLGNKSASTQPKRILPPGSNFSKILERIPTLRNRLRFIYRKITWERIRDTNNEIEHGLLIVARRMNSSE